MSNVQSNATEPRAFDDLSDAADAILDRWSDGEYLSEEEELEATDDVQDEETDEDVTELDEDTDSEELEEDQDEDPEEAEEASDEDDEEPEEIEIDDDFLVAISVDGEERQASLKDLKRLYGQEASLTRKSQEVAAKRKEAEESFVKANASYQKLIERAEARFKPYSEIDMLVASRQMSAEDFASLRREAKEAEEDVKFLKEEAQSFYSEAQQQYQAQQQEAAKECVKVLEEQLPDWGNELYNDIRTYAVSVGLPQEQVDQYVDPTVIMLINKARLYDQSQKTVESKKAKAKKTSRGKVLRSKKSPVKPKATSEMKQQRMRDRARSTQDPDDIASALMARWEQS
jgi:hypothetical protein